MITLNRSACQYARRFYSKPKSLLIIPLVLSAFTHLWNPIGFPYVHGDEGHYMRRAMNVLEGFGPQEQRNITWTSEQLYDHPYFGQLFLAGVLRIIGYPHILDLKLGDVVSIEMLHIVPRLLMGILAVVDTFLIYKIAERKYGRNVAFVAAALFAVMPMSWLIRRILLDSLSLPFILLSILFAMYYAKEKNSSCSMLSSSISTITTTRSSSSSSSSPTSYEKSNKNNTKNNKKNKENKSRNNNNNIPLVILSGIFLGLAIFTKIPAFTMIPLVGYLIISSSSSSATTKNKKDKNNQNNNNTGTSSKVAKKRLRRTNTIITTNLRNLNLKALGLWFIPVILIPAIWPAYAISVGQFENWLHGITYQAGARGTDSISSVVLKMWKVVLEISEIDLVLLVIGFTGLVYAFLKRDYLLLLWIVPFIGFFYFIGHLHLRYFYWIPIIPIFCIAAASLIVDLPKRIVRTRTKIQQLCQFTVVSTLIIFGLIIMFILLMSNVNANFFKIYAFIVAHLPHSQKYDVIANGENTNIIGSNWMQTFSWIPKYVFDEDHDFRTFSRRDALDIKDKDKVILIIDNNDLKRIILSKETSKNVKQKELYDKTHLIWEFKAKPDNSKNKQYPYSSISQDPKITSRIELRTNY